MKVQPKSLHNVHPFNQVIRSWLNTPYAGGQMFSLPTLLTIFIRII